MRLWGGRRSATALLVFAKAPQPGLVKTRLCPPLTPTQAARLYRAMLVDTARSVRRLGVDILFFYTPRGSRATIARLVGSRRLVWQGGGDLGARLTRAFARAFGFGYAKVIAIGSDSPSLPIEYIEECVRRLDQLDIVIGPADDGGYYLLGLARVAPSLFEEIDWSTGRVSAQTRARAHALGLRSHVLPHWYDVDDLASLRRLSIESRRAACLSHTRRAIKGMKTTQIRR